MAKLRCPVCGYTEDDGRPHDRAVYSEVCTICEPPSRKHGALFACKPSDLDVADAFTPPDPFSRKAS
jgi:hypothetical protein